MKEVIWKPGHGSRDLKSCPTILVIALILFSRFFSSNLNLPEIGSERYFFSWREPTRLFLKSQGRVPRTFEMNLFLALRSFEWVSAWLSGIIPSGAPPPTPRRSPPRSSGERRALTPLLSPNHRLFALNHLVNLLSRHMLGLTACAIPRQLDDSIPRENYPHESAKGPFSLSPIRSPSSAGPMRT